MLNKQIGWAVGTQPTWSRFSISSDPMIEVILVTYFNSNPVLTPLQKRVQDTVSACKSAEKYAILTLIFEKISDSHSGEGLRRPSPNSTPEGHLNCQVLRAPQFLNPALVHFQTCSNFSTFLCTKISTFFASKRGPRRNGTP